MTLSKCCGAPVMGDGTCDKCAKPCDTKPMKHKVKVGSKFRLGAWEWEVISKHMDGFEAKRDTADGTCLFGDDEADKLDWVIEETCKTCGQKICQNTKEST